MVRTRLWLFPLALVYVAGLIAFARSEMPAVDEALYALPAWNLATTGSAGTPVIEPSANPTVPQATGTLRGLPQHTYWILPVDIAALGAWYSIAGPGLLQSRLFSAFCGLVVLWLWYVLLRRIGASQGTALLAVAITALDPVFIPRATYGRMDMLAAALGFGGIAAYLSLRERSFTRALLTGQCFLALTAFAHPNGFVAAFTGFLVLLLHLDRRRLQWRHLFLAAVPYCVAGLCAAPYFLADPQGLVEQLKCNSSGRLSALAKPLSILPRELGRYTGSYGLTSDTPWTGRTKGLLLGVYALSFIYLLSRADLRRRFQPLLLLFAAYFLVLAVFENMKWNFYMAYTVPMLGAIAAVAATALWARFPRLVPLALIAVIAIGVTGSLRRIYLNPYRASYVPLIAFMRTSIPDTATIMGSAELAFGYGMRSNLIDDMRLGYYSGKQPDFVVMNGRYRTALEDFRSLNPAIYTHVRAYLDNQCSPIPVDSATTVYMRKGQSLR